MPRRASCYHVVSFYAGDLWKVGKRGERPAGIVRGTHNKSAAIRHARDLDAGGGARFVRAYQCDRAKRLFDLKA